MNDAPPLDKRALALLETVAASDPTNVEAAYQRAVAMGRLARSRACAEGRPLYAGSLEALAALDSRGAIRGFRRLELDRIAAAAAACSVTDAAPPPASPG